MKFSLKFINPLTKGINGHDASINNNYYKEANNWYQDIYESVLISRHRYRLLSISLGILLAISIASISAMLPLKKYVYRLIEVNQQTGEVAQFKEIEGNNYSASWVVTRYFINQYVINRHAYNFDDIKRTFNVALAMSSKEISDKYSDEIYYTNPDSPINILKKDYYREVIVLGVNQLNDDTAIVRFNTITHSRSNLSDIKKEGFQAVIKWDYQNKAESIMDRDQNPLGFTVNYYQVSPVNIQNN